MRVPEYIMDPQPGGLGYAEAYCWYTDDLHRRLVTDAVIRILQRGSPLTHQRVADELRSSNCGNWGDWPRIITCLEQLQDAPEPVMTPQKRAVVDVIRASALHVITLTYVDGGAIRNVLAYRTHLADMLIANDVICDVMLEHVGPLSVNCYYLNLLISGYAVPVRAYLPQPDIDRLLTGALPPPLVTEKEYTLTD